MTQTTDSDAAASKPKQSGQDSPAKPPAPDAVNKSVVAEIGGRKGPEPTRYGDWEKDGRCVDF